jgi:large subunit ribosomal protein L13
MTKYFKQPTRFVTRDKSPLSWYLIDAKGKVLGRLASEIAKILQGKHKVEITPNADVGDGVVIINAKDVKVTGSKEANKEYTHYTGFIGGLRRTSYRQMKETHPDRIIQKAVSGMIPKNKLGRAQKTRLRIFSGNEHTMQAQQPIQLEV